MCQKSIIFAVLVTLLDTVDRSIDIPDLQIEDLSPHVVGEDKSYMYLSGKHP